MYLCMQSSKVFCQEEYEKQGREDKERLFIWAKQNAHYALDAVRSDLDIWILMAIIPIGHPAMPSIMGVRQTRTNNAE